MSAPPRGARGSGSKLRWIIGDVQGCLRELERLVREIRYDAGQDELWSLGDLVNRGPESLETLRFWRDLGGRAILGNHDVYALLAHSGRVPRKGTDTLDALFGSADGPALLRTLRNAPALVHLPPTGDGVRDVWIVHAGLHPAWTDLADVARRIDSDDHDDDWLECEAVTLATTLRCCTADGRRSRFSGLPADCPAPYRPWDAYYQGRALIVHGHWARRGFYRNERTMGLDSGCVYGGPLTAWCQEEDRIVQVAARSR